MNDPISGCPDNADDQMASFEGIDMSVVTTEHSAFLGGYRIGQGQ
jgi:hypothetical protein